MALVVRAYPVKSRAAVEEFINELHSRGSEAQAFYERMRVHETWHYQDTAHGPIVIAVADVAEVKQAADDFQFADDPFTSWFKERVLQISGVNPNETPMGPDAELVYDSRAVGKTRSPYTSES
jgi:hypothetical protein